MIPFRLSCSRPYCVSCSLVCASRTESLFTSPNLKKLLTLTPSWLRLLSEPAPYLRTHAGSSFRIHFYRYRHPRNVFFGERRRPDGIKPKPLYPPPRPCGNPTASSTSCIINPTQWCIDQLPFSHASAASLDRLSIVLALLNIPARLSSTSPSGIRHLCSREIFFPPNPWQSIYTYTSPTRELQ